MDAIIENDKLKIVANTHGGEIHSIYGKKSKQEYIWKGMPFWWKIYCPTLFPIIGKVKNFRYTYNNEKYFMPEHGFAGRAKYVLLNKTENELVFELKNSEETEKVYPFKFSLVTKYTLIDNTIKISFTIKNLDDKEIYFSIGSHPAFKCPMYGEKDKLEDYYIKFEQKETVSKQEIDKDDFLTRNKIKFLENEDSIDLSIETFKEGTMMLNGLKSKFVELKSKKHNRSVKIDFSDFKTFSIWGPDRNTSFVCLEPWMGHADYQDFTGDIPEKEDMIKLQAKGEYSIGYSIGINE